MVSQNAKIHVLTDSDDFTERVAQRTAEILRPLFEQQRPAAPDTTPKTRKQAAKYIGVSLTTLNAYENQGIIQGYRVGNRRLYKVEDLDRAMQAVRKTATRAQA